MKAWQGHVTTCVHNRFIPLAKLLGADRVIALPHDPEKAELKARELFEAEDIVYDLCLITSEDSSFSETFCQEWSRLTVKSCNERRLPSDGYGFLRRELLRLWRWLCLMKTIL